MFMHRALEVVIAQVDLLAEGLISSSFGHRVGDDDAR